MINAYTMMMGLILLLAVMLRGSKPQNRKYILLSCLIMFCILGLRDVTTIGNDSRSSYLANYGLMGTRDLGEMVKSYNFDDNSGFFVFMKLIHMWTKGNYQAFVIIISAFIMIAFANLIYRYSPNPIQSFCYYWGLLLYLFMFSAQKQAMAMSFILFAFDGVIQRKPLRFLLMVFLAVQFHYPSLVFLPAYWLFNLKPGKYMVVLYLLAIVLTYTFRDQILTFMMNGYREDGEIQQYSMEGETFLRTKSLIMLVIIAVGLILRRPDTDDKLYLLLMEFIAIAVLFQTFCAYNNIFERLADYYFQFSVVFIPMVFDRRIESRSMLPDRMDVIVKTFAPYAFSGFGIWRMASAVVGDAVHYLPYRFYF